MGVLLLHIVSRRRKEGEIPMNSVLLDPSLTLCNPSAFHYGVIFSASGAANPLVYTIFQWLYYYWTFSLCSALIPRQPYRKKKTSQDQLPRLSGYKDENFSFKLIMQTFYVKKIKRVNCNKNGTSTSGLAKHMQRRCKISSLPMSQHDCSVLWPDHH